MKTYEIVAIGLRIFAIVLFWFALKQFVSVMTYVGAVPEEISSQAKFLWWATVAMPAIVSVLVWFFPLSLAKSIVPITENKPLDLLDKNDWFVGALIILGIYILSFALVDLAYWIARFQYVSDLEFLGVSYGEGLETKSNFYATLVEILIGLFLIIGASKIIGLIQRFRKWS